MIRFSDFVELTPLELEEELSNAGRRSLSRSMKRRRFKLARARKKVSRRRADSGRINKRANRQARSDLKKKISGGKSSAQMGLAQKKSAERRVNMMKGRQGAMAKRLRAPKRRADRR
tara:strand:+ start:63 stop:413 length:351 start_codon:yes stop_codon:yes gene_type:complete